MDGSLHICCSSGSCSNVLLLSVVEDLSQHLSLQRAETGTKPASIKVPLNVLLAAEADGLQGADETIALTITEVDLPFFRPAVVVFLCLAHHHFPP